MNYFLINVFILYIAGLSKYAGGAKLHTYEKFHGSGPKVGEQLGFITEGCNSLGPESLAEILGPAYNPRYMSVSPPMETPEKIGAPSDIKRKTSAFHQFFVDDDFSQELDDRPAWESDHMIKAEITEMKHMSRNKRAAGSRPWECEAIIKWIDLGTDYFPRYLRTVECTKHDCWYGKFTCKPRSFTVKLLRRKKGKCVYHNGREGVAGLPQELRELWVWEERAVNFCCDCAPPS